MSDRLLMKKEGIARYISHLDLMRTMQRVFVRAGLSIRHTEGYNPHPYISFALPLSVGTESECELMDFELTEKPEGVDIAALLTEKLPEGITVASVYESDRKLKHIAWLRVRVTLLYDHGVPEGAAEKLTELFSRKELVIEKKTKSGTATSDIAPMIRSFALTSAGETELTFEAVIAAQNPSLSPAQMMGAVPQLLPELTPDFERYRRLEVYDKDLQIFR